MMGAEDLWLKSSTTLDQLSIFLVYLLVITQSVRIQSLALGYGSKVLRLANFRSESSTLSSFCCESNFEFASMVLALTIHSWIDYSLAKPFFREANITSKQD